MNIIRKLKAYLRYKEAVRKAENAHAMTGERYYVLPMNNELKLMIMDRNNFRKLKFKGYMSRELHITNLEKECFYCTSYRNGKDKLPDDIAVLKRNQYYHWAEAIRKTRKFKKNHKKDVKKNIKSIKKDEKQLQL